MRILHVIAELTTGGAERIVLDLTSDAVARGAEVHVASAGGTWEERVGAAGGTHHRIARVDRGASGLVRAAADLAGVLRSVRPSVVHTHNVGVTVATRLAVAATPGAWRVPRLTTVHGLAHDDYPRAARLLTACGGTVVACAPAVARSLEAAGYPVGRLRTITNGAALTPAGAERQAALARALGVGERPLVAGIGRLAPQKAWATLVVALAGRDDVDAVVAGKGALLDELRAQAASARSPVRFVGAIDDVAALVELARCVVSTSTWEGLPLSLLEALSLGAPVVATAVDGVTDVVPPDAAVLVAPGDPDAVRRGLDAVLGDPALASRLSAAALAASRSWSPASMCAAYRALVVELLTPKPRD